MPPPLPRKRMAPDDRPAGPADASPEAETPLWEVWWCVPPDRPSRCVCTEYWAPTAGEARRMFEADARQARVVRVRLAVELSDFDDE